MKNRRKLAFLVGAASFSFVLSACSFGGDKPDEQVIVEDEVTPTPEPKKEEATPTPEPWEPVYTSKDGSISIEMPDESWSNKTDANDIVSIESEAGKIVIVHGDEKAMETLVLPESEDMASALELARDLEEGDFEILNYTNEDQDGVNVIYYLVNYKDTEKSKGVVRQIIKYISNTGEYYEITAEVKEDDQALLDKVLASVNSFKILSESSSLSGAGAQIMNMEPVSGTESGDGDEAAQDGQTEDASSGTAPGTYTDEDLADNNRTRTIYSNDGSGKGFVVSNNDDGTWSDEYGNKYRFDESDTSIVYDENDVDYYYHGEAGNVRFMYITEEG